MVSEIGLAGTYTSLFSSLQQTIQPNHACLLASSCNFVLCLVCLVFDEKEKIYHFKIKIGLCLFKNQLKFHGAFILSLSIPPPVFKLIYSTNIAQLGENMQRVKAIWQFKC